MVMIFGDKATAFKVQEKTTGFASWSSMAMLVLVRSRKLRSASLPVYYWPRMATFGIKERPEPILSLVVSINMTTVTSSTRWTLYNFSRIVDLQRSMSRFVMLLKEVNSGL